MVGVNEADEEKWTPLAHAIEVGNMHIVRILVEAGAGIEAAIPDDCSALLLAAYRDHLPLCAYLIRQGADVNSIDLEGGFPLKAAAENGNHALLSLLLNSGADATSSHGGDGMHALNRAAMDLHPGCVRVLLEHGVDPNLPDVDDTTALELLLNPAFKWDALPPDMQERRNEIIEMLSSP